MNGPVEQEEDASRASLMDRSISGMLWVTLDKLGGSSVNFLITVLLARLLFPEDFGLVAMVMVFFELSAVFVESGFSTALIRERTITEADRSTTFIFNMAAAILLYALLFLCAPLIATFYEVPALAMIVRVLGLNLIVDALSIVQSSTFIQRVDFRSQALARFGAVVVSGLVGVGLALQGQGLWALVARVLLNGTVLAILLWRLHPWTPSLRFDRATFRRLFGFGSRILLAGLLDKFFSQAYKLVIGKLYSAAVLGFYTQAGTFVNMAVNTLFRPIQTVSYPVLAKVQDDRARLKSGYRTILRLSSFIMFPSLVLLAVLAEPVVHVLLGAKWLPVVPYLRLLCIAGCTVHISSVNLNMLLVLNRPDLSLRLEVIKKVNIAIAILIGSRYGIAGLITGEVVVTFANLFINAYYSTALLGYKPAEQVGDILPALLLSLGAGAMAFFVRAALPFEGASGLVVSVLAGTATYALSHVIARTREWRLLKDAILPRALELIGARAHG